ncbi:MAG: hypothetical protein IJ928_04255 [Prevotella sp.]|nr:hypothetical protein [Prevotella sp.]
MKKLFFSILAAFCLCAVYCDAQSNYVRQKIYAFGFAASFNDSVVYVTDIQEIDSAWVENKTGFLVSRSNYSLQLREYLAEKRHEPNRTCIITYATKRKDIDKKYLKLKSKYTKKNDFSFQVLTSADFKFLPISPLEISEQKATKPEKKKKRKKASL